MTDNAGSQSDNLISIVMLVHNAPLYARHSIKTLRRAGRTGYELIVLDNASDLKTRRMLTAMHHAGDIDKLILLNENTFFARGNNIGSRLCDKRSKYILLLNSDVEIRNRKWLDKLLELHDHRGVTSFGISDHIYVKADGFCFLIDRDIYDQYKMDETFEWWWSLTKLQGDLLKAGYHITAVNDHEAYVHHYGQKSGTAWKAAKGIDFNGEGVADWFGGKSIRVIEKVDADPADCVYSPYDRVNIILKLKAIRKAISQQLKRFRLSSLRAKKKSAQNA